MMVLCKPCFNMPLVWSLSLFSKSECFFLFASVSLLTLPFASPPPSGLSSPLPELSAEIRGKLPFLPLPVSFYPRTGAMVELGMERTPPLPLSLLLRNCPLGGNVFSSPCFTDFSLCLCFVQIVRLRIDFSLFILSGTCVS